MTNAQKVLPIALSLIALVTVGAAPALARPSISQNRSKCICIPAPMPCGHGLMDFLYQRDGEIIAFARPDLAVAGTGLSSAAPVVGTIPACVPVLLLHPP